MNYMILLNHNFVIRFVYNDLLIDNSTGTYCHTYNIYIHTNVSTDTSKPVQIAVFVSV